MPNTKIMQAKILKNIMLFCVSTTVLSGVVSEAFAAGGAGAPRPLGLAVQHKKPALPNGKKNAANPNPPPPGAPPPPPPPPGAKNLKVLAPASAKVEMENEVKMMGAFGDDVSIVIKMRVKKELAKLQATSAVKINIVEYLKDNNWVYNVADLPKIRDDIIAGRIVKVEAPKASTHTAVALNPSDGYKTVFDKNNKYTILYHSFKDGAVKEIDVTALVQEGNSSFEQEGRRKFAKQNPTMEMLQAAEKKEIYRLVLTTVDSAIKGDADVLIRAAGYTIKSDADNFIRAKDGSAKKVLLPKLDYVAYYDKYIGGDEYKRYITEQEINFIKTGRGKVEEYKQKAELISKEMEALAKEIGTLDEEQYIKKCEEMLGKYGEDSDYMVPRGFMNSKIKYVDYEPILINEIKKRAVIAYFINKEAQAIGKNRLKIEKPDGTVEYVDASNFEPLIKEHAIIPDLVPTAVNIVNVLRGGAAGAPLPESEAIKQLRDTIDILQRQLLAKNGSENNTSLPNSNNDVSSLKTNLPDEISAALIKVLMDNPEFITLIQEHPDLVSSIFRDQEFLAAFRMNLLNLNDRTVLEMLRDNPDFISVIKEHPELLPSIFKDEELLTLLEENPELIDRLNGSQDEIADAILILKKEHVEEVINLQKEEALNTKLVTEAHEKIDNSTESLEIMASASAMPTEMIHSVISSRMMQVMPVFNAAPGAGDEEEISIEKGLWVSGLYGINKQGALGNSASYKGRTSGGSIGFDLELNDNLLGIAYSNVKSSFKYNNNSGKVNVTSHVLSLYGQKDLGKGFSLQGIATGTRSYVKNKTSTTDGAPLTGKYKNNYLSFETLLNYKYLPGHGLTLIPNIGIRYGHSRDGVYNESDAGVQHLSIAAKSQNLWTGIIGGKIAFIPLKISDSLSITPMMHGSIENHFNNKSKKVNAKVSWSNRVVEETILLQKQPRLGYNLGASVLAEQSNVKVLVEYNCHLQKKYKSHQAFVKLKVNF